MYCLNDNGAGAEFEEMKARLIEAFESILPEKSRFER